MIELTNIGVSVASATILKGYSLKVAKGSVLAILGANGVGKTTLLHTVMGLRKPTEGTVRVDGKLGFVPQLFQAAFSYSVIDMVLMGRARQIGLFGSPSAADYRVARDYLSRMGVLELEDRAFNTLSGGQRQLVVIAQALCSECDVLVLDEPCSALDYKNQSIVMQSLKRLNSDTGVTIVFTTHAPQHGLEVATEVLLMNGDGSYRHGPTAETLTAGNLTQLYGVAVDKAEFVGRGVFTFAPRFIEAS
jgi:iron complex transport system ATP-binding protein